MITPRTLCLLLLGALSTSACGSETPVPGGGTAPGATTTSAAMPTSSRATPAAGDTAAPPKIPAEPFRDGARVFAQVKDALLAHYYREGIGEDDLYRAATEGMLEHADPAMSKWNKLLTPAELADLHADLKGEVVGVGVHIDFDPATGYSKVLSTLPGSPAERAGLAAGDLIVAVDGILFKNKSLRDVVNQIRGKAGDKVSLTVLRDQELVSLSMARESVAYESASHALLGEGVGVLRIRGFTEKTPGATKASLEALQAGGATALVVDLRCNPGGALDQAVTTAGLLLPAGAGVVTLQKRGEAPDVRKASGAAPLVDRPLVVLVNGSTGSSAEFLAAALSEVRHAPLVGQTTLGKWTAQTLDDLPNGYAMKYTVSLLRTPSGKSFEGVGLTPDAEVSMDDKQVEKASQIRAPAERLAADVQLRTAVALLRPRR